MPIYIVLAVYRGEVSGKATGSRDFRAIRVKARSALHAIEKVARITPTSYENPYGRRVRWPLVDIMSCGRFDGTRDGDEVVGFIAERRELYGPRSLKTPSLAELRKEQRLSRLSMAELGRREAARRARKRKAVVKPKDKKP